MKNYEPKLILGDNLEELKKIKTSSIQLIYIDPPFNTGKTQQRVGMKNSYNDKFNDLQNFLYPRMVEAHRILSHNGSLFFHIDSRESHRCRFMLEEIFGESSFIQEIIWAYDYGGGAKRKWREKHDNIFWFAKNEHQYIFNDVNKYGVDRTSYMNKARANELKRLTSVWWNTIAYSAGDYRSGYPTQKPLSIIDRIIQVHSNKDDIILDFFAGSGTTGEAAMKNKRQSILIDCNPQAIAVMEKRLGILVEE